MAGLVGQWARTSRAEAWTGGGRVDSVILATADNEAIAVWYRIHCDAMWRVRKAEMRRIGDDRLVELVSDGAGSWTDGAGVTQPQLQGAIDIDISVTPFTNTLPIRRLDLKDGRPAEILVVYIQLPSLQIITDRQRYTRLDGGHYRYESVDSDFTRDIQVDGDGLVITYPGLFRRIL